VGTVVVVCLERINRYKGNPSGGSEAIVMEGDGCACVFITAAAAEGEASRRLLPGLGWAVLFLLRTGSFGGGGPFGSYKLPSNEFL